MVRSFHRSGRSVVVTNAGAGLGRDVALALAAKGYIIFGTAASTTEKRDLQNASGGRVSLTVCDMTNAVFVEAWAGGVADALGEAGLDILINDARVITPTPMELLSLEAIRQEFDCNVFSAVAVINAFIPALRKGHGRIVQMSPWSAGLPPLFSGPSKASDAALAVFMAAYRAELECFGIEVVLAYIDQGSTSPGMRTPALANVGTAMTPGQRRLYGKPFDTMAATLAMRTLSEPETDAAVRIVEIALQHPAPVHAFVGSHGEQMRLDDLASHGATSYAASASPTS